MSRLAMPIRRRQDFLSLGKPYKRLRRTDEHPFKSTYEHGQRAEGLLFEQNAEAKADVTNEVGKHGANAPLDVIARRRVRAIVKVSDYRHPGILNDPIRVEYDVPSFFT